MSRFRPRDNDTSNAVLPACHWTPLLLKRRELAVQFFCPRDIFVLVFFKKNYLLH
ncbi:hypothetical protein WN944_027015 [Citrus x changshan-huyou]|uniref:Uncharacterized protein n=1 Tax=Citrus x changshan-huyou TaxID=2935761 RepID=A0AAP0QCK4_9ROSI